MAYTNLANYCNYGNGSSTGYYAVAQWAATTYLCGNIIRQLTTPSVGNERCFVCTVGGVATTEPTWTVTRGAANTSGTATFQEATGIPALNGDLTNTPNWTAIKNTVVSIGQVIQNNAGTLILLCTVPGTAGNGAEPSWAAYTIAGATTPDNTVTWVTLGASFSAWASPHARLNNAVTSANWFAGGATCYLGSTHAETTSTGGDILALSSTTGITAIISVDPTIPVPPTASLAGASITVTGGGNVTLGLSAAVNNEPLFVYGLSLIGSTSTGASSGVILGASGCYMYCQDCSFTCSGNPGFQFNAASAFEGWTIFDNCNVTFAATATANTTIRNNAGRFYWNGGTLSIGGTQPTNLITMRKANGPNTCQHIYEGVDLSAFTGTNLVLDPAAPPSGIARFIDCKLGAFTNVGTFTAIYGTIVDFLRSDSANTNYRQLRQSFLGTMQTNTSTVRNGGATDGATPVSWQIASTANATFPMPFQLTPLRIWNDKVNQSVTVTIYGAGASVPNDNQLFYDLIYLGDASSSLGTFVTAGQSNPLSSGSPWTTDSVSTWTGSPANKFKKSITITPQQPGYLYVYLKQAAASETWYVDPLIALS